MRKYSGLGSWGERKQLISFSENSDQDLFRETQA